MAKKQKVNDQPAHGGHSGLEPAIEISNTGGVPYDHNEALESPIRSGLQPKGKKSAVTKDQQLGGGRSIVPELKDRNKL